MRTWMTKGITRAKFLWSKCHDYYLSKFRCYLICGKNMFFLWSESWLVVDHLICIMKRLLESNQGPSIGDDSSDHHDEPFLKNGSKFFTTHKRIPTSSSIFVVGENCQSSDFQADHYFWAAVKNSFAVPGQWVVDFEREILACNRIPYRGAK